MSLAKVTSEFWRVTEADGELYLIESNGTNPIIKVLGLTYMPVLRLVAVPFETPNETYHDASTYVRALRSMPFIDLKV